MDRTSSSEVINKTKEQNKNLLGYRIRLLIGFLVIPIFFYFYPVSLEEEPVFRYIIVALYGVFFSLTFLSETIRKNILHVHTFASVYPFLFWVYYLTIINHNRPHEIIILITTLFVSGTSLKTRRDLVIFSIIVIILTIVQNILVESPQIPLTFLLPIIIISLGLLIYSSHEKLVVTDAFERSANLLNDVFEQSPDPILLCDANYQHLIRLNDAAKRLLKIHSATDFIPFVSNNPVLKEVNDDEALKKETLFILPNGDEIWGNLAVKKVKSNDTQFGILIRIMDMSYRREAELSMKMAESIINQIDNLVIASNNVGEITYISPSVKNILGYTVQEMVGMGWWELTRDSVQESESEKNYVIQVTNESLNIRSGAYERKVYSKSGKPKWILWKDSIIKEGLMIGVGADITESKRERLLKETIFKISDAAVRYDSLNELTWFFEKEIRSLFQAKNLFIALKDENTGKVSFPIFKDEFNKELIEELSESRGLTQHFIEQNQNGLFKQSELEDIIQENKLTVRGELPKVLMAVPLVHQMKVFGLMVIQDYEYTHALTQKDLEDFQLIAGQVESLIIRKLGAESLKEREDRFRTIMEATFEGLIISIEGQIVFSNHAFHQMLGYPINGELISIPFLELVTKEYRTEAQKIISPNEDAHSELMLKKTTGDTIAVEVVSRSYMYKGEEAVLLAVRDVSERKIAEQAKKIAENQALLSSLIRNSSDVIMIISETGEVDFCSSSVEKILGYQPEEFSGNNLLKYVHPEDKHLFVESLQYSLKAPHEEKTLEYRFLHKKNSFVFLQSNFNNQLEDENVHGILLNTVDITSRKESEIILRESEEKYRTLVETMSEGIIITDVNNQIAHVNHRFAQMVGYSYEELVGPQGYSLIFENPEVQEMTREKTKLRQEGIIDSYEVMITCKTGEKLWVLISGSPYIDHKNNFKGTIGVVTDISELKNYEKALAESEEKYRTLFSKANDAILISNDDQFLDANEAALKMFGLPLQEIVGTESLHLSPEFQPDGLSSIDKRDMIMIQMRQRDSIRFYWKFKRANNKFFDGEVSMTKLILKNQVILISQVRDVTDNMKAQRALQESEQKKKAILDALPDLMFIFNSDGVFLDYHAPKEKLYVPPNQFLGKSFRDVFPPYVAEKTEHALEQFKTSDNPVLFEYVLKDGDGLLEYEARFVKSGTDEVLSLVRDITERKIAERALLESEGKNTAILNAIPDLMFLVNKEGYILDFKVNNPGDLIAPESQIRHAHMMDYLPEAHAETWMNYIQQVLDTQEPVMYEYEMMVELGQEHFEARLVPSGKDQVLTMVRNVTERKRAENELIKRNFELDSFVYRSSHDLKAPLNSIMGLMNLIDLESPPVEIQNYLNLIKRSIAKLENFIIDLTDYSRNKRLKLEYTQIHFSLLIDEAIENLHFMEHASRLRIEKEIDDTAPFYSDQVRINIILNNLLSNSMKYQNLKSEDSYVRVLVKTTSEDLTLIVEDNGLGIAEENLKHIFTMFYRASVQSYGSGLGLYIVHSTIDKLGGSISLQSKEGEGTTFTIWLPNMGTAQKLLGE